MTSRRRAAFAAATVALTLALVECVATWAYRRTVPGAYYVFEEGRGAIVFDPTCGYRQVGDRGVSLLARGRTPFDVVARWQGRIRGNSRGFPDADDFGAARRDASRPRVVVFGDSFTGGWLARTWPERVQENLAKDGRGVEMSNLSHVGYGLANWSRLLDAWVVGEKWQADGVVFAVWGDDLRRRWFVSDMTGADGYRSGRVRSWNPADYPKDAAEAAPSLRPWFGYPLGAAEYADALRGDWKPSRGGMPFLLGRVAKLFDRRGPPAAAPAEPDPAPDAGRGAVLDATCAALRKIGAPVLVVSIPSRESVDGTSAKDAPFGEDAREFATRTGGEWIDGREAFAGLAPERVRALWIEGDPHWRQEGSDVFADWMTSRVDDWARRRGVRAR